MNTKYTVRTGRTRLESKSKLDLLALLSQGDLSFDVDVRAEGEKRWTPLLQHGNFAQFLVAKLLFASSNPGHSSIFNNWHLKKQGNILGPFSLLQVLEFYKQGRVTAEDEICHELDGRWTSFDKCEPFQGGSLDALMACEEVQQVISRRKSPRLQYENELFLSADSMLFRGVTWSLSSGGVGFVTDQPTNLKAGQELSAILNANSEHGSVQIRGRVVHIQKESNYERVAIEFDGPVSAIDDYLNKRIPTP